MDRQAHVIRGVCSGQSLCGVDKNGVTHGTWVEQEQSRSSVSSVNSNRRLTASGIDRDESLCLWSAQELVIYSVCKVDPNKVTSGSLRSP